VLNNSATVLPETSRRVLDTIEQLQYEPNLMARNLRKNESRVILILAPNITNPYYSTILSGIGVSARQMGYSFMVCTTEGESEQEIEYLDMLQKRRADGAILLALSKDETALARYASKYPIVQCCEFQPGTQIPHVAVDNYAAARRMTEYLLAGGHRRIAMVSSVNDYPSTRLRLRGYRDALCAAGITPDDALLRYGSYDYSYASGLAAAASLLQVTDRPTAIFCISDTLALGAVNAVQDAGLSVPGDVSVVGFDNVELTTISRPSITTIAQPCFALGECAMKLLLQQLQGDSDPEREIMLDTELIVRASSADRIQAGGDGI
jgi:DNA-binding LacI/PurR family transcriptional regulator